MKKFLFLLILICSFSFAYELSLGGLGSSTVFDYEARESLLVYPKSWLKPHPELLHYNYQDSSWTKAQWKQIFGLDRSSSSYVLLQYSPFSFPHRWNTGVQFTNYKGANPINRSAAVFHFKHKHGDIEYYFNNNDQKINLLNRTNINYRLKTNSLKFKLNLNDKFDLNGGINLNFIEQEDDSVRNYDIHHEQIALSYKANNALKAYGKFHYWYWVNEDRQDPAWLFYPGLKYSGKNYSAEAMLRIASTSVKPIIILSCFDDYFYAQAYTKVRSSRLALFQSPERYIGANMGLKYKKNDFDIDIQYSTSVNYALPHVMTPHINDHSKFTAKMGMKINNIDLYYHASYNNIKNPLTGFYHPERAVLTPGLKFITPVAKGNLLLYGDVNAKYIVHEHPDNVSFDPVTLCYSLNGESQLVNDWIFNFSLKAKVSTVILSAEITLPFNTEKASFDYFWTSSDLQYGHGAYAGLDIEWFWWK